jgi:hypothetical protein
MCETARSSAAPSAVRAPRHPVLPVRAVGSAVSQPCSPCNRTGTPASSAGSDASSARCCGCGRSTAQLRKQTPQAGHCRMPCPGGLFKRNELHVVPRDPPPEVGDLSQRDDRVPIPVGRQPVDQVDDAVFQAADIESVDTWAISGRGSAERHGGSARGRLGNGGLNGGSHLASECGKHPVGGGVTLGQCGDSDPGRGVGPDQQPVERERQLGPCIARTWISPSIPYQCQTRSLSLGLRSVPVRTVDDAFPKRDSTLPRPIWFQRESCDSRRFIELTSSLPCF